MSLLIKKILLPDLAGGCTGNKLALLRFHLTSDDDTLLMGYPGGQKGNTLVPYVSAE